MFDKSLPMTGFEPRISGVGGDRSTNWATTTAQLCNLFVVNSNLWTISGSKSDYQNKVFFALKLGYSEALLQKALVKLGHNAEENQVNNYLT